MGCEPPTKIGGSGGDGRSAGYYTASVAKGRDDYYTGKREAPGQWFGAGAEALGLVGMTRRCGRRSATWSARGASCGRARRGGAARRWRRGSWGRSFATARAGRLTRAAHPRGGGQPRQALRGALHRARRDPDVPACEDRRLPLPGRATPAADRVPRRRVAPAQQRGRRDQGDPAAGDRHFSKRRAQIVEALSERRSDSVRSAQEAALETRPGSSTPRWCAR